LRDFDLNLIRAFSKAVVALSVISIVSFVIEVAFEIFLAVIGAIAIYKSIWPFIIPVIYYILLLIGNRKKIVWMYYPYLVLHLFTVLGSIILAIFLILVMVIGAQDIRNEKRFSGS
jgi:hypothetical protein